MAYLNFFPGKTSDERKFFATEEPAYAPEDLEGFVKSVIQGCASSVNAQDRDGLRDALEDGALLAQWFGGPQEAEGQTTEERAQQEAVEEVHAELKAMQ